MKRNFIRDERGNIVLKLVMYFLASAIAFMFITSFTGTIMNQGSSNIIGTIGAIVVFGGLWVLDFVSKRKNKK